MTRIKSKPILVPRAVVGVLAAAAAAAGTHRGDDADHRNDHSVDCWPPVAATF